MRGRVRQLLDLRSVGPATVADLGLVGVRTVAALAREDPDTLFARLQGRVDYRLNPCTLDVLRCAIAQARDPGLPLEQCDWWVWTPRRKRP